MISFLLRVLGGKSRGTLASLASALAAGSSTSCGFTSVVLIQSSTLSIAAFFSFFEGVWESGTLAKLVKARSSGSLRTSGLGSLFRSHSNESATEFFLTGSWGVD